VKSSFKGALVRSLEIEELRRAFQAATVCLLSEIRHTDLALAGRLEGPLSEMSYLSA